jgi:alpha-tubulin suppressor-like RCC1 family protein
LVLSGWAAADDVQWTNAVGLSVSGSTLTKTASVGWGNAGAASVQVIRDGYGYVEFTAGATNVARMCGLSWGDSDQNYPDIDFAAYLRDDGTFVVYEGGAWRGEFGPYASGDRIRVEVHHGVVTYRRNGVLVYTSTSLPRYPLRVDASLYQTGATLQDVRIGSVVWSSAVGVTAEGDGLSKTGSAGWNAGAFSANLLEAGDGALEFEATETDTSRVIGLGSSNSGETLADVEFAFHLRGDGDVAVVEGGTVVSNHGPYATGDRFRIEVRDGEVAYFRNGVSLATSSLTPTYPLHVDSAFETPGATVADIRLETLIWADAAGVVDEGGTLRKTGASGWNAGAAATAVLESGDGFVEWIAQETDTRRLAGLRQGTGTPGYADIDHGLELGETGTLQVVELGTVRAQAGSYGHGDRLRVEVYEGGVRYLRNGSVLYASTVAPAYPLQAAAALYSPGATLAQVTFGDLVWMNVSSGLQASGSGLFKPGAGWTGWGDEGGASTRAISSGYLEVTATETTSSRMVGLGHGDGSRHYDDIEYAVYLSPGGGLGVYENGANRGGFGSYASGDRIRIAVANSVVTYSKNGDPPFYTSTVTPPLPLRADTAFGAYQNSLAGVRLVGAAVADQVATPSFSHASGTWTTSSVFGPVTITSGTLGATVRYTTDGSDPTEASTLYASPIPVDQSLTLKARGFKAGWTPSPVATATYVLKLNNPNIWPNWGGTQPYNTTITSNGTLADIVLRFTTNGQDPTESDQTIASGGTLLIDRTMTVKVRAWRAGYEPSNVSVAVFTMSVGPVTLSPTPGAYSAAQNVTLDTVTPGAALHYRLDGLEPTEADPSVSPGGTVAVTHSVTLKVKGFRTGWTPSDVKAGSYFVPAGTVAAPTISPPGGAYSAPPLVSLATTTGATIRFTVDGSEPDARSALYVQPLNIDASQTLKAKAFKSDWTASATASAAFTIDAGSTGTPVFSPPGGRYATRQTVTLATATPGALIHYSTDGSEPDEADPSVASGGTVVVNGSLILRARAYKSGLPASAVRSAAYHLTGAVSAGMFFSLALASDGQVYSFGSNELGKLGLGDTANRNTPTPIPGLTGVVAVAGGERHAVALKEDGSVWGWGWNQYGAVGDGTTTQRLSPVAVVGLTDVVAVAAGSDWSLALKRDGTLWWWGLDPGCNCTWATTPAQVPGLAGVTQLAATYKHALAIKGNGAASGSLWSWGSNQDAQLGQGVSDSSGSHSDPRLVAGVVARALAAGLTHSLALTPGGDVWAWGRNDAGQLGDGTTTSRPLPVPALTSGLRPRALSTSYRNSILSDESGGLWTWGATDEGLLGLGDDVPSGAAQPLPQHVVLGDVMAVDAGLYYHVLAVDGQGAIWAWGRGTSGELGDGASGWRSSPNKIPGFALADNSAFAGDFDGDGLSNAAEAAFGTDPTDADTNDDGVSDGTAALSERSASDPDADGDGVANIVEQRQGTDALVADTDGDGHLDGADAFPLDPSRWEPLPPTPGDTTPPTINLQEPTGAVLIGSQP